MILEHDGYAGTSKLLDEGSSPFRIANLRRSNMTFETWGGTI